MTAFAPDRRVKRRKLGPFSATLVLWLVLIGVVAFIGSLVAGAFGSNLDKGDNGAAHALSRSAIGFAGMVEILRKTGTEVEISRNVHPDEEGRSLLVLTPPPHASPDAVRKVAFAGPRLIVLPKWAPGADNHSGWVKGRRTFEPTEILQPVNGETGRMQLWITKGVYRHDLFWSNGEPFARTGPIDGLRTLQGDDWTPLIVTADGGTILGQQGADFILSDPDFLNTQGISDLIAAKTGLELLKTARVSDGPVVFDVSLNGIQNDRNLLQLIFQPPFLGVTLALALAVLLLAVQAAGRFGPPAEKARAFALGKQGLADNSAALIRLARREHQMVERYALYVRGEAARAVGAPHSIGDDELESLLDRLSDQQSLTPFTQLRREAAAAHDLGSAVTAARRLYIWRLEMTRERR